MATPQQPIQQPVYPRDLSLALDRTFTKFVGYTDGKFEALAAQIRIEHEESLMRDNDLANNMRSLADSILKLAERVSTIETTQKNILTTLDEIKQRVTEGFAAQAERHNELMLRVDKLERNR